VSQPKIEGLGGTFWKKFGGSRSERKELKKIKNSESSKVEKSFSEGSEKAPLIFYSQKRGPHGSRKEAETLSERQKKGGQQIYTQALSKESTSQKKRYE